MHQESLVFQDIALTFQATRHRPKTNEKPSVDYPKIIFFGFGRSKDLCFFAGFLPLPPTKPNQTKPNQPTNQPARPFHARLAKVAVLRPSAACGVGAAAAHGRGKAVAAAAGGGGDDERGAVVWWVGKNFFYLMVWFGV